MATYGTVYKRVFGKDATITVTIGGDTYALAQYVEVWWQYAIQEVDVLGSEIPIHGTKSFRGGILIRRLYSTDVSLLGYQALSSGQVPESTITIAQTDMATPTTTTWTIKARLTNGRHINRIGAFVVTESSGPLTAVPTVA